MLEWLWDIWEAAPASVQDTALLVGYLVPSVAIGAVVLGGFRPYALVRAMVWRFRWTNALFVLLIAVSIGIGVGLIAQERGLRQGTGRAAEKFDLIVSAPGSEVTMLLAAVYLQPADVPLLSGAVFDEITRHEQVRIAAPLAFGDSFDGAPVVGTIADFVGHLSGSLADGRLFEDAEEAVVGARVGLALGATFAPAHGIGVLAEHDAHQGVRYTVVGRMQPTGSPWDRAILVPVEAVWEVHGLANGHAPERRDQIGPPFDAAYFPGTPAVLVRADELWATYALQSEFNRGGTMAFLPGAVLARLHELLGDVRQVMSALAVATQVLVAAGVLTGLIVLVRLYGQRLALLRALGAPRRFIFSLVWAYAVTLIGVGALLGIGVGLAATVILSRLVTAETDILVRAGLGWPELHLVAAFFSLATVFALVPAMLAFSSNVIQRLRT